MRITHTILEISAFTILKVWTPPDGLIKLFEERPNRVQILVHPENWTLYNVNRESTLRHFFEEIYNKYRRLEEEKRKAWLNCCDVLEYNRLIGVLKNYKLHIKPKEQPASRDFLTNLVKNIKYYKKYCFWYLINSEIGWQIHTILENLRKTLKSLLG